MSMGAMSITIALDRPGTFDIVGALGGYPDWSYMMAQMLRLQLAGFCPLERLEDRPDDLDDADADPPVVCGPGRTNSELEYVQSFNQLHYDSNGITMDREFYGEIIENFSTAFGNLAGPSHPDAPSLPAGLDLAWFRDTSAAARCESPQPLPAADSYNAEYNPVGAYPVIPLCDQRGGPEGGEIPPSWFDVDKPRDTPIGPLLAVDINGNGRRDLAEPLFLNPWERFEDVGVDGCADAYEDGAGGCLSEAASDPGDDPNGDRYDWTANPDGTELNDRYDVGEPFDDFGVDGVEAAVSGVTDDGEGNGVWDAVSAFDYLQRYDGERLIREADQATLDAMDFWFDAGIRDALHAGVVGRNLVAALRSRGREVTVYSGFAGRPGTLWPDGDDSAFFGRVFELDYSMGAIGRDVYVEYGDPNATEQMIEDGDGKHVGTALDAVNRLSTFIIMAANRLPEPDVEPDLPLPLEVSRNVHYYSEALQARRSYIVGLPPGYDLDDKADTRYPVLFFLHGLGQDAADLAPAAGVIGLLTQSGDIPKVILVFPDGGCCFVDRETGKRECACRNGEDGEMICVDPDCKGAAETCDERVIAKWRLDRECTKGSLYANMRTNVWGEPRDDLRYMDTIYEIVQDVDANFRTRSAAAP
ncbi:MAG: hypothetical protein CSA66_00685 [Proteobacteria bacterium]|nr:MAG: hypothetical protein CSA66_00685 [Pseudomonadota bacterium]